MHKTCCLIVLFLVKLNKKAEIFWLIKIIKDHVTCFECDEKQKLN